MKKIFDALLRNQHVIVNGFCIAGSTYAAGTLGYIAYDNYKYHQFQDELYKLRLMQAARRERILERELEHEDNSDNQNKIKTSP